MLLKYSSSNWKQTIISLAISFRENMYLILNVFKSKDQKCPLNIQRDLGQREVPSSENVVWKPQLQQL